MWASTAGTTGSSSLTCPPTLDDAFRQADTSEVVCVVRKRPEHEKAKPQVPRCAIACLGAKHRLSHRQNALSEAFRPHTLVLNVSTLGTLGLGLTLPDTQHCNLEPQVLSPQAAPPWCCSSRQK